MDAATQVAPSPASFADRTLLLVEDDKLFLQRLARAMESRGFAVRTAETVSEGLQQVDSSPPAFAVVDLRLSDGNGLDVISALKKRRPDARGIVLTGYGNIATAVTAVKLGALRLSVEAGRRRRSRGRAARDRREEIRAAGKSDVRRSRALGTHPAHLRTLRSQRVGDGAPAQHASAHAAAHSRQARAEVKLITPGVSTCRPASAAPSCSATSFRPATTRSRRRPRPAP